jgi:hypothetical protein
MPRATLLAGCLILGLSACKHPNSNDSSSNNLYGTDDPTGLAPINSNVDVNPDLPNLPDGQAGAPANGLVSINANVEVNPDLPDLPVREAWSQGGTSVEVHRSASCPTESVEDNGCGNETSYRFTRSNRELQLSACRCSSDRIEKKLTLSNSQAEQIDKLMGSLEMVSGPQLACTAESSSTLWELIVENSEKVEQSYPVALCGTSIRQAGKINARTFQALYEYLKKTLPE